MRVALVVLKVAAIACVFIANVFAWKSVAIVFGFDLGFAEALAIVLLLVSTGVTLGYAWGYGRALGTKRAFGERDPWIVDVHKIKRIDG